MSRILALMLVATAALLACSQRGFDNNVNVTPQPVANVDFSPYRTWNFGRTGEYVATGVEHMDSPQFRAEAAKHFAADLAARGYTQSETTPDLTFLIHVSNEQKFDEQKMDDIYKGYDMAWYQLDENDVWNEGTMVIFALDSKTGQQVWSSTAQAKLQEYVGFQDRLDRFNKVVSMMLADFPKRAQ